MEIKNADLPAYPLRGELYRSNGLTKREIFAMAAMQGICTGIGGTAPEIITKQAVRMADELLKQLSYDH